MKWCRCSVIRLGWRTCIKWTTYCLSVRQAFPGPWGRIAKSRFHWQGRPSLVLRSTDRLDSAWSSTALHTRIVEQSRVSKPEDRVLVKISVRKRKKEKARNFPFFSWRHSPPVLWSFLHVYCNRNSCQLPFKIIMIHALRSTFLAGISGFVRVHLFFQWPVKWGNLWMPRLWKFWKFCLILRCNWLWWLKMTRLTF